LLRNPYVAGVERFEASFSTSLQADEPLNCQERAAHFCLLLWRQFQPELRTLRYTMNCDYLPDTIVEFAQQPRYDELVNVDASNAQQIDIECIGQQSVSTGGGFGQRDEHFPAFLEVFIPLRDHPIQSAAVPSNDAHCSGDRLVIWCQPPLLPKVTTLWERAGALLLNGSS
jgi:hypothetical protein